MLTELHIENLGVIDTLDLQLSEGLVALTGETGAGKTMIVEAINFMSLFTTSATPFEFAKSRIAFA